MSLSKDSLKGSLKSALSQFKDVDDNSKTPDEILDATASKIADAIDAYIRQATITVVIPIGAVTQGAGAASAPNVAPITVSGDPSGGVTGIPGGIK